MMSDKEINKKTYGKGFERILDILDILDEIEGPFTTNMIVKEMKRTDSKIRHETIKKYLELIYEISNRGILDRSFEQADDYNNLILWNFNSDKTEDSKKLYAYLSKLNTIKGVEIEIVRIKLGWTHKRIKNTIEVLLKQQMIQLKSNRVFLERSWLDLEEWINRNTIDTKDIRTSSLKKKNYKQEELNSPKLKDKNGEKSHF